MLVLNDLDYSMEASSSMVCRSWTIVDVAIKELRTLSNSTVPSRKLSMLIPCIHSCKLYSSKRALTFRELLKDGEPTDDTHSLSAIWQ